MANQFQMPKNQIDRRSLEFEFTPGTIPRCRASVIPAKAGFQIKRRTRCRIKSGMTNGIESLLLAAG
jgi:hypothetical protein